MPELEKSVQIDTKAGLIYIAGYIVRNEVEEQEEAKFYYGEFGDYAAEINLRCLKIPNDNVCQWTIFSYILSNEIVSKVSRKSLCNVLMLMSQSFNFNMDRKHAISLSNIFLKNYVKLYAPRSSKVPQQGILKLSK